MPALIPVIALSFVAGFVDTVGFIALFGLFTAHVTGNFVLIGSGIAGSPTGLIAKLLALPVFIAVVAAVAVAVRRAESAGRDLARPVLIIEIVLLVAFMLAGLFGEPFGNADTLPAVLTGLAGVAAMAVQNAGGRLTHPGTPTTVMTGNVTQAVIDSVDLLRAGPKANAARTRNLAAAVVGFAVGALLGAIGYSVVSYLSLAVPVIVLVYLVLATRPKP
ncbi:MULTISPECIES: YoaK family protein [Rhodomicrobium]|uniref:YoaK family protein n=1 Tax=Rhodomicrobium TaxID=1068 RepID=UPI000B4BE487|nr:MULTISPECIES: YoaK family protein [Rhodomicrobium]